MKTASSKTLIQQTSLFLVAMASSTSAMASTCNAGFYDPLNGSNCIAAAAGTYVPSPGASVAFQAEPGKYVPDAGSSIQTLASPGFFVDTFGAIAQTPAPAGFYIPNPGAISAIPADLGKYVPNAGSSIQTEASPGFFVDVPAAIAQTPAPAGFYVPTSGATSALQAELGKYVPNAGSSVQTAASPGFFVDTFGATAQTPAPAGFYVPISGATSAQQAEIGTYVPTAGASSATPVSRGFYTVTAGATAQIPAGGLAAPLTAALQTSALFNNMSTDLLDDTTEAPLKVATAYQHNAIDQDGLSSGTLDTDIAAITLQANLLQDKNNSTGVQLSYGDHSLDNSNNVDNNGNSIEVGAFQSGNIKKGRYQAFLVYGQTDYDNKRNVKIDAAGTNLETLTSSGDISWYGARSEVSYPLVEKLGFVGQLGLLNYSADGVHETGVATLNGSPTASIAALNAKAVDHISAPIMVGVSYDIIAKNAKQKISPITLETGIISNLNSTEKMQLTSTSSSNSFDLPITQSSRAAGLVGLKMNALEIGNGFSVTGTTQAEFGADEKSLRAGVNLVKRW